jgi:hypothetical protein
MEIKEPNQDLTEHTQDRLQPKIGQVYWVQCKNHRIRATMDKDGKWRALYDQREMPEVISFFLD